MSQQQQQQQLKPEEISTVAGYRDKLVGGVKETVGGLLGMEKIQKEGIKQKQKGEAELKAAMAQQRAMGDRSREQREKGKGRLGEEEGGEERVDSYFFLKRQAVLSELQRMSGFERQQRLRHVDTREPDVRKLFAARGQGEKWQQFNLRRWDIKPLLNDIREKRTRKPLSHVEPIEKGLMNSIKLTKNDFQLKRDQQRLPNLWADIKRGDNLNRLKKVNRQDIRDRSGPRLDLFKGLKVTRQQHDVLLKEIAAPPKLKSVETKDKTKPNLFFDKNVHVHKFEKAPLLDEVRKGFKANAKHVETKDKSKPLIEKDFHLKRLDRQGFLAEVRQGTQLKHV
jgi:uncharacterized protein YjbJ (UPF0337 family)